VFCYLLKTSVGWGLFIGNTGFHLQSQGFF